MITNTDLFRMSECERIPNQASSAVGFSNRPLYWKYWHFSYLCLSCSQAQGAKKCSRRHLFSGISSPLQKSRHSKLILLAFSSS